MTRRAVATVTAASTVTDVGTLEQLKVSRTTLDTVRLLVCLLLVMTISRIHQHFSVIRPLRPALLVAGLAVLAALANRHALRADHLWRTVPPKLIAGIAVMACVSAIFGISLGGAASFILYEYSKVLILAFLLVLSMRTARDLFIFVWAYVLAAGILSWLSIFVFRMSRPSNDGLQRILSGYTFDANDIGLVVLIGFALSLLTFQASGKTGKLVSAVIMVGIGITLAKTGSRGAFVGAMATGLAVLALVKSVSLVKRLGYILVPAVALVVAAPQGYWDQMRTMLKPKEDYNWNSQTGRRELMKRGITYMMSHPLTGIGVENFPRAEGTISIRVQNWNPSMAGIKWSAAHNSFLQAAAEMGFPGLILFVCLVGCTIVIPLRLRGLVPRRWARGDPEQRFLLYTTNYLPVAGVAFATAGFFVSFAYTDPIYILAAFAAGLSTGVKDRLAREQGATGVAVAAAPVPVAVDPQRGGAEWRSRRWVLGVPHAQ